MLGENEVKERQLNKYFGVMRCDVGERKKEKSVGVLGLCEARPQEASEHNVNREHVCY